MRLKTDFSNYSITKLHNYEIAFVFLKMWAWFP